MNKLSYEDLAWEPVCLQPSRYSLTDGVLTPWGAPGVQKELVCVDAEHRTASMGMPAGQGKVSDAGYDQMMCLAAAIPACDHVVFRGTICIRRFPLPEEQNGQEGLGLFFRDTLEPDPITGYPYSNMIAGGIFRGALGVFGREGILPGDVEQIRTISRAESAPGIPSHTGGRLEILLEKHEARVAVTIAPEGSVSPVRFEIPVDEEIFFRRERDTMYLGFLAARGCEMEIDLDTVSVEYGDEPENGDEPPVLYASRREPVSAWARRTRLWTCSPPSTSASADRRSGYFPDSIGWQRIWSFRRITGAAGAALKSFWQTAAPGQKRSWISAAANTALESRGTAGRSAG